MLTKEAIKQAIHYNRRRGFDDKLIEKIQRLIDAKVDGIIGPKTVGAVAVWQQAQGLKVDGKIGPNTLRKMNEQLNDDENAYFRKPLSFVVAPGDDFTPSIIDRIKKGERALEQKAEDQNDLFQGQPRDESIVDGVVLHQMAFSRGNALHKYDKVTAHFFVTPAGEIAQIHPFSAFLYASNALNSNTVAVEFAGNFRDDTGRFWGNFAPNYLTARQVTAGRYLLEYLNTNHGIKKVFAHRQGTGGRRANCCGPEIWKNIAQYAIANLNYDDMSNHTSGAGPPIPDSWK